jgi:integrase/recombinase XerD
MNWNQAIKEFESFLRLEKSLSANSIEAYSTDVKKLVSFLEMRKLNIPPERLNPETLRDFITWIHNLGMSPRSQSRVISGIKAFHKFLLLTDQIDKDPSELLESP